VLKGIFGRKEEEVAGGWRRLHNEGLHNCTLHHIIKLIKSRRMGWAGYVTHMVEMTNTNFCLGNMDVRYHSEYLSGYGSIILE
jgi:hypothetical protein